MQPTPPELPPLAPMTPQAPPVPTPAAAGASAARPTGGTKRLRQAVAVLASGGVLMVGGVLSLELIARPGLRPSDLMAMMEARTELGVMNQRMGHGPGEHVLNEAQYQEILAQSQRQGAAKAELVFQRELAAVQADKERVVGAYTTLYQRTNIIAQAGLQMEAQAQAFRQQLIQMTNGGRAVVIGVKDMACGLGSEEACESARRDREIMVGEGNDQTQGDVAAKIRALMEGIDDPATFVTHEDQRRQGTPSIRR